MSLQISVVRKKEILQILRIAKESEAIAFPLAKHGGRCALSLRVADRIVS
jgi:hypothetical protein